MCETFPNLPDMRCTDLAVIGFRRFEFYNIRVGIIIYNDLHDLIRKTFIRSKGEIIFNDLYLC